MKNSIYIFITRFLVVTILLLASGSAYSANYYLSKSGSNGGGTSWTAAWNELSQVNWATVASGGTLYIAAGTYTTGFSTDTVSGITVKRATVSDHGTDIGWNSIYDGQVTVDPTSRFLNISSANNFTFDGVSHSPWKFRVVGIRGGGQVNVGSSNNVTIRNIELDGNSENPTAASNKVNGLNASHSNNLIVEHCYIHDYRNGSAPAGSQDAVEMPSGNDVIFRYNIFANCGMHLFLGDYQWGYQWVNGITIVYNLFYNASGVDGSASYRCITFKGTNRDSVSNHITRIENNTFAIRSDEAGRPVFFNGGQGDTVNNYTGSYFRNNILYNSTIGDVDRFPNHSYNCYYDTIDPEDVLSETGVVTSDPLIVSYTNNDFHLQSNSPVINKGTNLGWQYDIDGNPMVGTPDMGCFEYGSGTGVKTPTISTEPKTFELSQNYPNPFNPTTSIKYQVPKNSFVKISVYNILGVEVRALVNEEQTAGSYQVKFDGNGLSSGIYFYKIQAGEFNQSKKMLLTK